MNGLSFVLLLALVVAGVVIRHYVLEFDARQVDEHNDFVEDAHRVEQIQEARDAVQGARDRAFQMRGPRV